MVTYMSRVFCAMRAFVHVYPPPPPIFRIEVFGIMNMPPLVHPPPPPPTPLFSELLTWQCGYILPPSCLFANLKVPTMAHSSRAWSYTDAHDTACRPAALHGRCSHRYPVEAPRGVRDQGRGVLFRMGCAPLVENRSLPSIRLPSFLKMGGGWAVL